MPDFVRARHDGLDVETVLPVTALPYLDGWEQVPDDQPAGELDGQEPASVRVTTDGPPPAAAVPVTPAPTGTTPVGRPTLPQES